MSNARLLTVLTFVLFGIMSRFLPHPPNFTAINAIGLFSASFLASLPFSFLTVFAAIFLSDLVIGFYPDMLFVYLSFGLIILIGHWLHYRRSLFRIGMALSASSLLFFLVTNFGAWWVSSLYPKTGAGLAMCYVAAIPFLANQVCGDIVYTAAMFGLFALVERFFAIVESRGFGTAEISIFESRSVYPWNDYANTYFKFGSSGNQRCDTVAEERVCSLYDNCSTDARHLLSSGQ